jgi:hypothetical protein
MADFSKLKRPNSLGEPPSPAEASRNLSAPEIAPAPIIVAQEAPSPPSPPVPRPRAEPRVKSQPAPVERARLDGRSLRRTGRTMPLSTHVTLEFDDWLRGTAQRTGMPMAEVLEHAMGAYERMRKVRGGPRGEVSADVGDPE